jgi:DhnA family fructose-bisphosphate aldolase class Ia
MRENVQGFLDGKVMIASLNRGGHPNSAWELHDPITGTDAATCRQMKLDGAKMLFRMESGSKDSLKTLMECVQGVSDMSSEKLPIFIEPLPVEKKGDSYGVIKDADLLTELVSITAALGNTSRYVWLKLPYTANFEKVVRATTLPIVILGGGKSSDIKDVLGDLDAALQSGHQVRGAMFGRNLLFPDTIDSRKLSDAIGQLVHQEKDPNEVLKELNDDQ